MSGFAPEFFVLSYEEFRCNVWLCGIEIYEDEKEFS